ncbi:hypothetical protein [Pseudarthrobacter sp. H2]|uniref:hypothetical protein n=1 Tax=Pseudarthrobacter sp. H2 TaxID=3418415 RepID=UPI003CF8091E
MSFQTALIARLDGGTDDGETAAVAASDAVLATGLSVHKYGSPDPDKTERLRKRTKPVRKYDRFVQYFLPFRPRDWRSGLAVVFWRAVNQP